MRNAISLLLVALIAATIGLITAGILERLDVSLDLARPENRDLVTTVAVAGLAFLAVLAVHELGHVIAGRAVGFEFQAFVVGPIRVHRRDGRLRLALNRSLSLAGGIAVLLPTGTRRLRRRMAIMTAGGPVASLAIGGLLLGVLVLADPALPLLTGLTAALSLGVGLVTLVPGTTAGFATDGRRLYLLLRGGDEAEREVAMLSLVAASQAGVRPASLDRALLKRLQEPEASPAHRVTGFMLAYDHHLDRGEYEAAGEALDRALSLRDVLPATAAPALSLEAAYFTAVHRSDAAAARAFFETAGRGALVPPETPLRAEAAVLIAEGRPREAIECVESARAVLDEDLDRAAEETARRQIDALARTARERARRS